MQATVLYGHATCVLKSRGERSKRARTWQRKLGRAQSEHPKDGL